MLRHCKALPALLLLAGAACFQPGVEARGGSNLEASNWYDRGLYGASPRQSYQSFGGQSPRLNVVQRDPRCHDGFVFLEPQEAQVGSPNLPTVVDNLGNLIWMPTTWAGARDLKVQRFNGSSYISFWHGTGSGKGAYIMLDESYEVFKEITPVGSVKGDLQDFRTTEDGTALITVRQKNWLPLSSNWIYDSIFQEIDLDSGELLFAWHASDHFLVDESWADSNGQGRNSDNAFDFFHINSIDKDADGNYLVSSRELCAVVCISRVHGRALWQLGGDRNGFRDLSGGAATSFSCDHQASLYENTTLTLFDNGSNGQSGATGSRLGLMIELDLKGKTASLVHSYEPPQKLLGSPRGSIQVLPNDNVLVGWSHPPAYTEFSFGGEVLCDTRLGSAWFARAGWTKGYRASKHDWVGRPKTVPDVAMRPREKALYVSWNGATEVDAWVLQSGSSSDLEIFVDYASVTKTTFETRIALPAHAQEFLRVVALDSQHRILGYSNVVSKNVRTEASPLSWFSPTRNIMAEPEKLLALAFFGLAMAFCFRGTLQRGYLGLWRLAASLFHPQHIPSSEKQSTPKQ